MSESISYPVNKDTKSFVVVIDVKALMLREHFRRLNGIYPRSDSTNEPSSGTANEKSI